MNEVRRPTNSENEAVKEILHGNVASFDKTKNLINLITSEGVLEDSVEEDPSSVYRGNISRRSSISPRKDKDGGISCKFDKMSESFPVNTFPDRIKEARAMQEAKIDEVMVGEIGHGKDDEGAALTREIIQEVAPIAATRSSKLSGNVNDDEVVKKARGNDQVKTTDGRKLKTATLDRVGRMFKSRSSLSEMDKFVSGMDGTTSISEPEKKYGGEQPSRQEKTNSLGRMLKLVDKDGTPKKLFAHSRAGSLSRIFRKHSATESNESTDRTEEESPGIFSRMFNHLRGRSANSRNRANPRIVLDRVDKEKASLPPKVPVPSKLPPGIPSRASLSGSSSSPSATPSTMPEKQHPRSFQRTSNLASYEP